MGNADILIWILGFMVLFSSIMFAVNKTFVSVTDLPTECGDIALGNALDSDSAFSGVINFILNLIPGFSLIVTFVYSLTTQDIIAKCGSGVIVISWVFSVVKTLISGIGIIIFIYLLRGNQ